MWTLAGAVLLGLVGCSTSHYRKSADKAAYGAIQAKSPLVPNMTTNFTIEATHALALDGLPTKAQIDEFLGPYGEGERGATVLSLEQALALAVQHSRTYQNSKETLYLAGLALTGARHQFAPLFSGRGNFTYSVDTEQGSEVIVDPVTGEQRVVLSDELVAQHRLNASGDVGVNWLIRDIGRVTAAFTTDFFRLLTGDPSSLVSSQVGGTFLRPLLRDAGFKSDTENLTQAERNLLYAVREFVQFRKNFTVDIARGYYDALGSRDAARNSFLSLQSFKRSAERTRALAKEGRATQSDLGRLQQQEYSTELTWVSAVRSYRRELDDFKIQLGLPIEANVVLADQELEQLKIVHPGISVDDSIQVALAARLDYQNLRDQQADAVRRVALAADQLKPQLDLVAQGGLRSEEQDHGFPLPDPERYQWSAGLNVDLPFDRLTERNSYRSALITEQRATRALALRRDEIIQQVRESWRTLEQARRSYEISELGVSLAERRVKEQNLLAELGRAKAQDQVDAQNDLVNSRNARTQALVGHTVARLQFWNNLGILFVKEDGQWEEVKNARVQ